MSHDDEVSLGVRVLGYLLALVAGLSVGAVLAYCSGHQPVERTLGMVRFDRGSRAWLPAAGGELAASSQGSVLDDGRYLATTDGLTYQTQELDGSRPIPLTYAGDGNARVQMTVATAPDGTVGVALCGLGTVPCVLATIAPGTTVMTPAPPIEPTVTTMSSLLAEGDGRWLVTSDEAWVELAEGRWSALPLIDGEPGTAYRGPDGSVWADVVVSTVDWGWYRVTAIVGAIVALFVGVLFPRGRYAARKVLVGWILVLLAWAVFGVLYVVIDAASHVG